MESKKDWNISLGTIRGVPVRVHGSFVLLVIWVITGASGASSAMEDLILLLMVFLCVFLHECGHVFTARLFKIVTKDITLYPFGGIATIVNQPTPIQELIIAIAGPIVSLLLALLFFLAHRSPEGLFSALYVTNLNLALFNLIPAIPMDGGRIFRSLLQLLRFPQATLIAARVSQLCSIGLAILGIYLHNFILVFIGVFVFFGAVQELMYRRTKEAVLGQTAEDLMIEREKLFCFQHGTTLTDAIKIALRSLQEVFPVLLNDQLLGLVSRHALIEAVSLSGNDQYISGLAERDVPKVEPSVALEEVLRATQESGAEVVSVIKDDQFLGLVFVRNISDVMIVNSLQQRREPSSGDELV